MSLFRDTAFSALSTIAGTGVRFLVTIMLARTLAPDSYGQYVFLQWVIDFASLACSFGLPGVMTRFLPQLVAPGALMAHPLMRQLLGAVVASIVLTVLIFVAYTRLDHRFSGLEPGPLAMWCVGSVTLTFLYAGLQGLFRYDAVMAGNLAFAAAAPIATLLLVQRGSAVSGAEAMALAFGVAIAVALSTWRFMPGRRHETPMTKPVGRSALLTYSGSLWISGLLSALVWSRGELGILRLQVGNSDIALYSAALTVCGLINQGMGLLTGAITPHLVRRWNSSQSQAVTDLLLGITQATLFAAAALSLVLIGFGREIVPLMFGPKYDGMYPTLCLLAASGLSVTSGCAHLVLQIETNAKFGLLTDTLGLALLLGVGLLLSPWLGMPGVAIGRAVSQVLVAAGTFWQLRRLDYLIDASKRILRAWLVLLLLNSVVAVVWWKLAPALWLSLTLIPLIMVASVVATQRIVGANVFALLRMR